jgi:hypothetical protein
MGVEAIAWVRISCVGLVKARITPGGVQRDDELKCFSGVQADSW